eukprot:TRINITY_DN2119_c0_g2_i1.p1 TRINITY_DN2119_c0_g2~~TRINITY_DN2119_c0_g2_i1.p1  ORF type:complete len:899 (+),score=286.19 TRINITY_DN2119_c0_g2_i1:82-2778(+)
MPHSAHRVLAPDPATAAVAAAAAGAGGIVSLCGGAAVSALLSFAAAFKQQLDGAAARHAALLSGEAPGPSAAADGIGGFPSPDVTPRPWLQAWAPAAADGRELAVRELRAEVDEAAGGGCIAPADGAAAVKQTEECTAFLPRTLLAAAAAVRCGRSLIDDGQRVVQDRVQLLREQQRLLRCEAAWLRREAARTREDGEIALEQDASAGQINALRGLAELLLGEVQQLTAASDEWARRRKEADDALLTAERRQRDRTAAWRDAAQLLRDGAAEHRERLRQLQDRIGRLQGTETLRAQKLLAMQRASRSLIAEIVQRAAAELAEVRRRAEQLDLCSARHKQLGEWCKAVAKGEQEADAAFAAAIAEGDQAVAAAGVAEGSITELRRLAGEAHEAARRHLGWAEAIATAQKERRLRLTELHAALARLSARQRRQAEALQARADREEALQEIHQDTLDPAAKRHKAAGDAARAELKRVLADLAESERQRDKAAQQLTDEGGGECMQGSERAEAARREELIACLRERLITDQQLIAAERVAVAELYRSADPARSPRGERPKGIQWRGGTTGAELEGAKTPPPEQAAELQQPQQRRAEFTARVVQACLEDYPYLAQNEREWSPQKAGSVRRLRDHTDAELESYETGNNLAVELEKEAARREQAEGEAAAAAQRHPAGGRSATDLPPKCATGVYPRPAPHQRTRAASAVAAQGRSQLLISHLRRPGKTECSQQQDQSAKSWVAAMRAKGIGAVTKYAEDQAAAREALIWRPGEKRPSTAPPQQVAERQQQRRDSAPQLWSGEPLFNPDLGPAPAVTARGYRVLQEHHDQARDPAHRLGIAGVIMAVNDAVRQSMEHIVIKQPIKEFWSGLPGLLTDRYQLTANVKKWEWDYVILEVSWETPELQP